MTYHIGCSSRRTTGEQNQTYRKRWWKTDCFAQYNSKSWHNCVLSNKTQQYLQTQTEEKTVRKHLKGCLIHECRKQVVSNQIKSILSQADSEDLSRIYSPISATTQPTEEKFFKSLLFQINKQAVTIQLHKRRPNNIFTPQNSHFEANQKSGSNFNISQTVERRYCQTSAVAACPLPNINMHSYNIIFLEFSCQVLLNMTNSLIW